MAYFRPVQAEGRPASFEIAEDSGSFERGAVVLMKPDGKITSKEDTNLPVVGIVDDNYSTTYSTKVINEVIEGSGSTNSSGALDVKVYTTNKPLLLDGYTTSTDLFISGGSIKLQYKKTVDTEWSDATTDNWDVKISNPTTGEINITAPSLDANSTYQLKLTISYSFINTNSLGYNTVLDISSNDTTLASKKATVYFMPGIYETDQFDPYVSYEAGSTVYVVDGTEAGLITTASDSNKPIGIVLKAPSAALSAENLVVYGHENPVPNSLRILMRI